MVLYRGGIGFTDNLTLKIFDVARDTDVQTLDFTFTPINGSDFPVSDANGFSTQVFPIVFSSTSITGLDISKQYLARLTAHLNFSGGFNWGIDTDNINLRPANAFNANITNVQASILPATYGTRRLIGSDSEDLYPFATIANKSPRIQSVTLWDGAAQEATIFATDADIRDSTLTAIVTWNGPNTGDNAVIDNPSTRFEAAENVEVAITSINIPHNITDYFNTDAYINVDTDFVSDVPAGEPRTRIYSIVASPPIFSARGEYIGTITVQAVHFGFQIVQYRVRLSTNGDDQNLGGNQQIRKIFRKLA